MDFTNNSDLRGRSKGFRQHVAQEQAEQKSRLDQSLAPILAERQRLAAQYAALQAPTYRKPLPELKRLWTKANGNIEALSALYWNCTMKPDLERTTLQPPEEAEAALQKFVTEVLPAQGWVLGVGGVYRLTMAIAVAVQVAGEVVTTETCQAFFDMLRRYECFDLSVGEISFTEPQPQPEPAPKVSLEEIDSRTPEGRMLERQLVTEQAQEHCLPLQRLWFQSLADNYDGFKPTRADWEFIITLFQRHNLDPNSAASYDRVRRLMCKLGKWDARRLLTLSDLQEQCVDRLDMSNRDTRHVVFNANEKQVLIDLLDKHGVPLT